MRFHRSKISNVVSVIKQQLSWRPPWSQRVSNGFPAIGAIFVKSNSLSCHCSSKLVIERAPISGSSAPSSTAVSVDIERSVHSVAPKQVCSIWPLPSLPRAKIARSAYSLRHHRIQIALAIGDRRRSSPVFARRTGWSIQFKTVYATPCITGGRISCISGESR